MRIIRDGNRRIITTTIKPAGARRGHARQPETKTERGTNKCIIGDLQLYVGKSGEDGAFKNTFEYGKL